MSRPLRIEYPGAWYHVMNRGRWSEQVFFSNLDHEKFIKEKFHKLKNIPEISESKFLAQEAENVILSVCGYYRVSKSDLMISKRGSEKSPRDIAIYLVRRLCSLTLHV